MVSKNLEQLKLFNQYIVHGSSDMYGSIQLIENLNLEYKHYPITTVSLETTILRTGGLTKYINQLNTLKNEAKQSKQNHSTTYRNTLITH
jgi:hypothetical protein